MTAHAKFWINPALWDALVRRQQITVDAADPIEFAMILANIRRGIANFVHILTGRDIPVKFVVEGKESLATEDDRVTISASTDPAEIDATCGVACHEGAHLILSKKSKHVESIPLFDVLKTIRDHPSYFVLPETQNDIDRLDITGHEVSDHIKLIFNVLEDRRIDHWVYERAPGYRPYYEAMYAAYWHSPEIDAALVNPDHHTPCVENYMRQLVNISNPNFNPKVMPGLDEIWQLVNLPDIRRFGRDNRWGTWYVNMVGEKTRLYFNPTISPEMIAVVMHILRIIYANSTKHNPETSPELSAADEKQRKFLSGNLDKDKITPITAYEVEAVESSGAEIGYTTLTSKKSGIPSKVPVIVYRKLTDTLLRSDAFPFTKVSGNRVEEIPSSRAAVTTGTKMGMVLAHRLRAFADESPLTVHREKEGTIDQGFLASLGHGAEDVFLRTTLERRRPVSVHLTLDGSSSMLDGMATKWSQSLALAVALIKCSEKVRNMRVVVSIRAGDAGGRVQVLIAYDSRVDRFHKTALFRYLTPSGYTPEGLAYDALKSYISSGTKDERRFLVNISDGVPYLPVYGSLGVYYNGPVSHEHTAAKVRELVNADITVLSYFVYLVSTDSKTLASIKTAFSKMYGKAAQFVNPTSVPEIARTLNAMFMRDSD